MKTIIFLSLFCVGLISAAAQTYALNWFTIDGGGGASTGGVFNVRGTIGQPDAGRLAGGNYALEGGFWGIVSAIQQPGAPLLTITRSNSSIVVSWPLAASAFLLDETTVLTGSPAIPWAQVPFPYYTNATDVFIVVPAPAGDRFYRLRKP